MQNSKESFISLCKCLSKSFAYQPMIKFLGPRHLLQNNAPKNSGPRSDRKLIDISEYKHEFSTFQRKPIEVEEIDTINTGGKLFKWRGVKKIKVVKEEED